MPANPDAPPPARLVRRYPDRTCLLPECERSYTPTSPVQRYCSARCRQAASLARLIAEAS